MTAKLQLSIGIDEEATDVKITRSKDGDTSIAVFIFDVPNCMSGASASSNEILGMYMIDEEGHLIDSVSPTKKPNCDKIINWIEKK